MRNTMLTIAMAITVAFAVGGCLETQTHGEGKSEVWSCWNGSGGARASKTGRLQGRIKWKAALGGEVMISETVFSRQGIAYVCAYNDDMHKWRLTVYAVRCSDGKMLWKRIMDSGPSAKNTLVVRS